MERIIRKTLLYKSGVEYADFCINHVEGCSHGCTYPCYAMMLKKRCGVIKNYKEWIEPKLVGNALELLDVEIPRYREDINYVYLSFSTDPFMYKQPKIIDLSLKIIERLNRDKIKSVCISKGIYSQRLTKKDIYGVDNEYGSTVITLSESFRKKFEPFAAPIKERIKALKFLHEAGIKTWVSMEPYPTPNFIKQEIDEILDQIKFVDKIVFGKWNYNGITRYFKDYKEFYNETSYRVISFCKDNGIDCHIKKGTISHSLLNQSSFDCAKSLLQYNIV